jgi:hypothetical protein
MAETADTPEVRLGWLRLAEKWLSMMPSPDAGRDLTGQSAEPASSESGSRT